MIVYSNNHHNIMFSDYVQKDVVGPYNISTAGTEGIHYETCVFIGNGGTSEVVNIYSSRDEALAGHQAVVDALKDPELYLETLDPNPYIVKILHMVDIDTDVDI